MDIEEKKEARWQHQMERWWKEDDLVHNRQTWLLNSQAMLFAGYGLLKYTPSTGAKPAIHDTLITALPYMGGAFCIVIALGITAARQAQIKLYLESLKDLNRGLGVSPQTSFFGWLAGFLIPAIFYSAWWWVGSGGKPQWFLCAAFTYFIFWVFAVSMMRNTRFGVFLDGLARRID